VCVRRPGRGRAACAGHGCIGARVRVGSAAASSTDGRFRPSLAARVGCVVPVTAERSATSWCTHRLLRRADRRAHHREEEVAAILHRAARGRDRRPGEGAEPPADRGHRPRVGNRPVAGASGRA
jgi:hypothetical protein